MTQTANQEPIKSELVEEDPTFADLVEMFVDSLDSRLQSMRESLDGGEFEALASLAHQLKGAGGGHGYPVLTEVAGELEQSAKNEQLDACKSSVDKLTSLIARVVVGP